MSSTKREYLQVKRYHKEHADKREIEEIIECCKSIFNSAVGKDFLNSQNLIVEFFDQENGVTVYEQFCKQYFPSHLTEYYDDYTEDGYMDSFVAQAFIDNNVYGILCSLDSTIEPNDWYEIVLHEMVHIYCTTHESDRGNFFEKYCVDEEGKANSNGIMGAGYAVWREFIAYYWGAELTPFSTSLSLVQVREKVRDIDEDVDATNPVAKMLVSQILAYIFRNPTVRQTDNVATAFELLERNKIFTSSARAKSYKSLIETVFEQLSKEDYWKISTYFIDELGSAYIGMLSWRHMETLRNG